ncbi:hypothetical protein [Enterobacter sp.]|uniref:hypothetical protein n=1 Tax=Enterobacter sp. TaxID=42895 RepID=UPI0037831900
MLIPFSSGKEVTGVPFPAHLPETQDENKFTLLPDSPVLTGFVALTESNDLHPVTANITNKIPITLFIFTPPEVRRIFKYINTNKGNLNFIFLT